VSQTTGEVISVSMETLARAVGRLFTTAGCPPYEAAQIACGLTQANLFGHDSHGVLLAPIYISNLRNGLVHADRSIHVVADHGAIVGIDGQLGFGQAIGEQAMRLAIERAQASGCCVLGLSNTHHLGRIGQWAEQCAQAGLASVHFVNVLSTPLVAPWGGSDARMATNPFCVGLPREPQPLILDFATSKVALGKVRVARDAGKAMANDVLLDADGRASNDPEVMFQDPIGALLPFGEHKGFALAVMCELLGGAVSGGKVQHDYPRPNPMINNMLSLVFAADKLVSRDALARQLAALEAWLKASPKGPGSGGIHLPGEPERATARERQRHGIPLPRRTCEALAACARDLGVSDENFLPDKSNSR
jgi:hydroxycarboxylate dehydrogenase B